MMLRLGILSYRFIRNKPLVFFMLTIMLAISMIACNLLISTVYGNFASYRIINRLDYRNYAYFQIENQSLLNSIDVTQDGTALEIDSSAYIPEAEREQQILSQMQHVDAVSKLSYCFGMADSASLHTADSFVTITATDSSVFPNLEIPLEKGKWYDNTVQSDVIPVVVSQDYNDWRIGSQFTVLFGMEEDAAITFEVCGILTNPAYMLCYDASGDTICSLDLICTYQDSQVEAPLILCSAEVLHTHPIGSTLDTWASSNSIIVFDSEASEEEISLNCRYLENYGSVATKDTLRAGTTEQILISLRQYVPLMIFLLLIGVIGLISTTILNILQYQKQYAIFFICGANWRQCIMVNILYIVYTIIGSLLLLNTYYQVIAIREASYRTQISAYNIVVTALLCIIIMTTAAIAPYAAMKKATPKEILAAESE